MDYQLSTIGFPLVKTIFLGGPVALGGSSHENLILMKRWRFRCDVRVWGMHMTYAMYRSGQMKSRPTRWFSKGMLLKSPEFNLNSGLGVI